MAATIFYGAGEYARVNLTCWRDSGLNPVCFVDRDEKKHYTKFPGTEIEILPLSEAISRYPDYKIYISVSPENAVAVHNHLLESGVSKERIDFAGGGAFYKGCHMLSTGYFSILQTSLGIKFRACCCPQGPFTFTTSKDKDDLIHELLKCEEIAQELMDKHRNNESCVCDGCANLIDGYYSTKRRIQKLVPDGVYRGERCNVSCIYCNAKGILKNSKDENYFSYDEILDIVGEHIPDNVTLLPGAGEFFFSPNKEKIYEIMKNKNWHGLFLTNGLIFDKEAADMMRQRKASIDISIDAGTRETFAKIKSVNYWDKLLANLEKYAQTGGYIQLKYIFLENINDNKTEIDGFFDVAVKYASAVKIAADMVDMKKRSTPLSENCRDMMKYFIETAKNKEIPLRVDWRVFDYDKELCDELKQALASC
ncbi:MAG: radical SAM protein [Oscillospiraceae bacterium]|nr:radical SAM protein [Oscillospiraceae bacterium]